MESTITNERITDSVIRQHVNYILHTNKYTIDAIVRRESQDGDYERANVFITTAKKTTLNYTFSLGRPEQRLQSVYVNRYGTEITFAVDKTIINLYINHKYAQARIDMLTAQEVKE